MRKSGGDEENRLAALDDKLDSLADKMDRLQSRLDVLHDECQRAAASGQRMLLRQEGLEKSLARLEALLRER